MPLETGTFISDLVATNPVGTDALAFADDHLRLVKSTIKNTFPNVTGAVTKTHTQLNNTVDKSGDTMTGPLTLPGAPTNANHAATKAYVDAATGITAFLSAAYPVGSIYINATSTTNPATLLGFGTWVEFGAGRVMVGQNTSDTAFDVLEETGGSKDAIVVAHTHTVSGSTDSAGTHSHTYSAGLTSGGGSTTASAYETGFGSSTTLSTSSAGAHSHTFTATTNSTGSSGTNGNLQPYIVVRMWKRTA